jgi:arginase
VPVTFVVVPQWQGSSSTRAMRLVDGAEAIRGDLPSAGTRVVDVPLEAGDDQGTGVQRASSIELVRDRLLQTLSTVLGPAITIGGDCSVELGAISHALDRQGVDGQVAVVWFDAHPDIHSVESSSSKAFHGMVVRTLLGDGPARLVPPTTLPAERLVLAGMRAPDPEEAAFLDTVAVATLPEPTPESIVAAIEATGATSVYLHIDLDVLDPAEIVGIGFPEPFGLTVDGLVGCIRTLLGRWPLAGAGLMEFAPSSSADEIEDLPTILRIVGALAKPSS